MKNEMTPEQKKIAALKAENERLVNDANRPIIRAREEAMHADPRWYARQPSMPLGMWSIDKIEEGVPDGSRDKPVNHSDLKGAVPDYPVVKTGWRDAPSGQLWG